MECAAPDTVTRLLVEVWEGRDEAQQALYDEVYTALRAWAMRHILSSRAERQRAQKRGGEQAPVSLDELRASLERAVATAEALGVSGSMGSRDWDFAQAWLYREMKKIRGGRTKPDEADESSVDFGSQ